MASTRTQIYLTAEQRAKLDDLRQRTGMSLAEAVRAALDSYLDRPAADRSAALRSSFGAAPGITAPSRDEWDRASAAH